MVRKVPKSRTCTKCKSSKDNKNFTILLKCDDSIGARGSTSYQKLVSLFFLNTHIMSKHAEIRRYSLVIEKIRNGQYPSFREIRDFLHQQGFQVGDRTIQRDMEQIRFEFGIEIKYNHTRRGYFIDYENSVNIESFFHFLEIVNTAELLTQSLLESKDALRHISFDTGGGLKGIHNLKPLLRAIREHRKIFFKHYNFQTEKTTDYIVKPYLLREYQNRWYVVGIVEDTKKLRIFGIDRITNLEVKAETFACDQFPNPVSLFDHTIGLVFSQNTVQDVILSLTPTQGKYIKTLPLHRSQEILIDNAEECKIKLHVIPNYELTQEILRLGDTVKVLEPEWLATEIRQILKNTLKQYK